MDKKKLDELNIKSVLVLGLGYRTGVSVSNFLASKGIDTCVSDMKNSDELQGPVNELLPDVKLALGDQSPELLNRGFDIVVISPGVPKNIPLVEEAYRRNIPVISEIELAYKFLKGTIIAITGTDGKTTTTSLTGHILDRLGFSVQVGGNIGVPLISIAENSSDETITVVELSSFQLETIEKFRPHIASILNVTPDHLDRYPGMEDYFRAKLRITMNQVNDDCFIWNMDDSIIKNGIGGISAGSISFSLIDNGADAFYRDGWIYIRNKGDHVRVLETERLQLMGLHNIQNVMSSILMVTAFLLKIGAEPDYSEIARICCEFPPLEHRMEKVGEFEGRVFINDSKATTISAVNMALKSIRGKGILILGGRTKGDDYSRLADSINGRVRSIVLIGESAEKFSKIFKKYEKKVAGTMDEAVASAMKLSSSGDVILFSPACASFDMFSSYEERGKRFKESFNKLVNGDLGSA